MAQWRVIAADKLLDGSIAHGLGSDSRIYVDGRLSLENAYYQAKEAVMRRARFKGEYNGFYMYHGNNWNREGVYYE